MLSDRLELRLPPATMAELRREAVERGTSVAGVVRAAIDLLLYEDRLARRRAAEALFAVGAPVADWPTMEQEIEDGRADDEQR